VAEAPEDGIMSADGSMAQSATASTKTASNITDVAFGIDERFAAHTAAVIASVVHHGRGGQFRFIIMHTGVTRELQQRIEAVAPGQRFVWIEVTDDDLPPFANRGHFTRATLFRMGLEKLAPADANRIVYLDADITVLADVRKLAAIDLEGAPVGAVHDPNVDAPAFGAKWNLAKESNGGQGAYFNAGILLIDLAKVRAEGLFEKAIAFFAEHTTNLPWNDQDALNWALWGRWKKLDTAWNVQRSMAITGAAAQLPPEKRIDGKKPAIIHFTGGDKPWIAGAYHPWSHAYWLSLKRTPFFNAVAAEQGVGAKERLKILARHLRWWPWTGKSV
jgi:lipopolysaccharide biosynthesis glycosyltransferase